MAAAGFYRIFSLFCVLHAVVGFTLISSFPDDTNQCESVCQGTYPPHTYDKVFDMGYCMRGCRFFAILDYTYEDRDLNSTLNKCTASCEEAYPNKADACISGCKSQLPITEKRRKKMANTDTQSGLNQMDPLYPLLYMHNMYSNMVEKMVDHMCETWSFYNQGHDWTGKVVIIQRVGRPTYIRREEYAPGHAEYKTVNYLESNLAAVDNSATPNIKRSQLAREVSTDVATQQDDIPADWLGCIAKKTGLPRLLICFTIFISAMMMVWLCFASVATAPEQKIVVPKMSINGDLEYLNEIGEKKGIVFTPVHLQEETDAAPLPFKVKVEQL